MSFSKLQLSEHLTSVVSKQFNEPTPIQEQAIPAIIDGKDVLGIAKTGSGKTACYVLPIINELIIKDAKPSNRNVPVLILVPTRELAVQVLEVVKSFTDAVPNRIKSMAVYGGVSINPQMIGLQNVQLLIATPGRLLELIDNKAIHLSQVHTLVLDEADKMLNLGFQEEVNRIISLLPIKRQNLLFSATLSDDINVINQLILKNPLVIKIEEEEDTIDLITQTGYFISEEKKGPLLRHLIKENNWSQVLVFTSSTFKADSVTEKLNKNGIEARSIHSKKSQGARLEALNRFKSGKTKVLVATDLISRGIDIQFLPYVINYELPRSPKDYIHRIGRTGRAENPGEAISFVSPEEQQHFKVIQKKMKKWVTMIDGEKINF
ncbi:MAG: DEAD/DEAH box helicase [Crocinitomicaceae bacterium]|nr:DEAD/DEAH box helicase [Crocinitomicaceae bacterium]